MFGKLVETRRANARFKLHSQVHFESKKSLCTKNFWIQKNFSSEKILGLQKCWFKKSLSPIQLDLSDLNNPNLTLSVMT